MRFSLNEISAARIAAAPPRRLNDFKHAYAWKFSELGKKNRKRSEALRDIHKGERCIVICTGPSLMKIDLDLIKHERSICMNRSYLMFDKWGFTPTYFAAFAEQVLVQFAPDIRQLPMPKFVDFNYRSLFPMNEGFYYLRLPPRLVDRFDADLTGPMTTGGTITFISLQIAFYLGFETTIIIGMDHRYSEKGIPTTTEVRTSEIDKDHIHPNYFPKGVKWQLPDLRRSEQAYRLARRNYEAVGRRIIDATVDGACMVFEKMPLAEALATTGRSVC